MQIISQIKLQNLYIQKALGVEYIDNLQNLNFSTNQTLPQTLNQLQSRILNCTLCPLAKGSKNRVFGLGSSTPKVMFVGYTHSKFEDEANEPFGNKARQMLEDIVTKVLKLTIDDVYFTNIFKCQVSGSDNISEYEIQTCKPYTIKQIELLKPKIIVTLGESSYNTITNESMSIENIRGHIINFGESKIVPTYHPNFLLRNPSSKKEALSDFNLIKELI